jgi:glutathione S-transferase
MMRLHQFAISPFCDKVRRALRVKGQTFDVVEVPVTRAPMALRRLNPAGKVPVLEHAGRLLADSSEILLYLEDVFPNPPLLPMDARERALCHMLEDWADESLYFYQLRLRATFPHNAQRWLEALLAHEPAPLRLMAKGVVPRVVRKQLAKQGVGLKSEAQVLAEVQRHLDALVDWLGDNPWLVGQGITIADLSVFAQVDCIRGTDEGGRMIASRPTLGAWMDRVDAASA